MYRPSSSSPDPDSVTDNAYEAPRNAKSQARYPTYASYLTRQGDFSPFLPQQNATQDVLKHPPGEDGRIEVHIPSFDDRLRRGGEKPRGHHGRCHPSWQPSNCPSMRRQASRQALWPARRSIVLGRHPQSIRRCVNRRMGCQVGRFDLRKAFMVRVVMEFCLGVSLVVVGGNS